MLPDLMFGPLDLADAIAETQQAFGAHGVVDLLRAALTDKRVRSDMEIDEYLDRLKSACRQTRRYRDAIGVFERIAALNPARRAEVAAEVALVHAHLGEVEQGLAVLRAALGPQRRLTAQRRSLEFCLAGELAALALHQPGLAKELAAMSRSAAQARPRAATPYTGVEQVELLFADRRRPRLALVRAA